MSAPDSSPSRIGPYRVLGLIGKGGMARVYRAWDARGNREVAIKVMRPEVMSGSGSAKRFRNTARILQQLHHPNITRLYELGEERGVPFLAMELVDGVSLDRCQGSGGSRALPPAVVARVTDQVASALDYAHRRKVIHRDLKPANILITRDLQRAVLSDFGLARALADPHITLPGVKLGTPRYMPPELMRDGGAATWLSDIYALGVTSYELLTGRPAFDGTLTEVAAQIVAGAWAPASRVNSRLPAAVDEALRGAMTINPAERYRSAGEFARALRRALGLEQEGHPLTPTPRSRGARDNGQPLAIIVIAVALCAVAMTILIVLAQAGG